jgi:RNA polymerase sigma-70 factor (ECF subfamily)
VRHFEGPLVGFLFARTGSRDDAMELAQEAFLRAWASLARYDETWRFSTWLYTIAARLATSRQRRASVRRDAAGEASLVFLSASEDPIGAMSVAEERQGIWAKAIEVLSEEQRSALWLRYVDELSAEEIGHALGRRAVTVRVILFRARERLARTLDPEELLDSSQPSGADSAAVFARRVSGGSL